MSKERERNKIPICVSAGTMYGIAKRRETIECANAMPLRWNDE
jgi:hypothetical protein